MMGFIRSLQFNVAMLVVAVVAQPGWGGELPIGIGDAVLMGEMDPLDPNDIKSTATVETDEGSFQIRVVTWDDAASHDPTQPMAELDPREPARTAIEFQHPYADTIIHINFVELLAREVPGLGGTQIQINRQLPFTREAEIRYLEHGLEIRHEADLPTVGQQVADPVCWVTGDIVLEIPVLVPIESASRRGLVPIYFVEVVGVSAPITNGNTSGRQGDGDGGTPGGSPDPDFAGHTNGFGSIIIAPETGDGGTPGGSPDPDGRRR